MKGSLTRIGAGPPAAGPATGCDIKGNINININSKGEQIYHVKGMSPNYDDTVVDESAGERWFRSEAEAIAAGWRDGQVVGPGSPGARDAFPSWADTPPVERADALDRVADRWEARGPDIPRLVSQELRHCRCRS